MDLGRKPMARKKGLGRQPNSDHKGFWKEQQILKEKLVSDSTKNQPRSELDKYKDKVIQDKKDEVKQWEKENGNSGNFFKDAKFGFKSAKKKFFDPVLNVANKASPVLNKIPIAGAALQSANAFDKVASKLQ